MIWIFWEYRRFRFGTLKRYNNEWFYNTVLFTGESIYSDFLTRLKNGPYPPWIGLYVIFVSCFVNGTIMAKMMIWYNHKIFYSDEIAFPTQIMWWMIFDDSLIWVTLPKPQSSMTCFLGSLPCPRTWIDWEDWITWQWNWKFEKWKPRIGRKTDRNSRYSKHFSKFWWWISICYRSIAINSSRGKSITRLNLVGNRVYIIFNVFVYIILMCWIAALKLPFY